MMKNSKLKQLIKKSNIVVPSLKEDLKSQLSKYYSPSSINIKKRKLNLFPKLALAFSLLLVVIIANFMSPTGVNAETYVAIDINPSLELKLSSDNKVIAIRALNEQGELLLFENNLVNSTLEYASKEIFASAVNLSYIDTSKNDNKLRFTVVSQDDLIERRTISNLNNYFNSYLTSTNLVDKVNIVALNDEVDQQQARSLGVGRGKLTLINQLISQNPSFTLDECKNMSVKELNDKIKGYDEERLNNYRKELDNEFKNIQGDNLKIKQDKEHYFEKVKELIKELNNLMGKPNEDKKFEQIKPKIIELANELHYEFKTDINGNKPNKIRLLIEELANLNEHLNEEIKQLDEKLNQDVFEYKRGKKAKDDDNDYKPGKGNNKEDIDD